MTQLSQTTTLPLVLTTPRLVLDLKTNIITHSHNTNHWYNIIIDSKLNPSKKSKLTIEWLPDEENGTYLHAFICIAPKGVLQTLTNNAVYKYLYASAYHPDGNYYYRVSNSESVQHIKTSFPIGLNQKVSVEFSEYQLKIFINNRFVKTISETVFKEAKEDKQELYFGLSMYCKNSKVKIHDFTVS